MVESPSSWRTKCHSPHCRNSAYLGGEKCQTECSQSVRRAWQLSRSLFAVVQVAMTANAARFVSPLTFETLSGNRVVCGMFDRGTEPLDHITWGQESDLVIIAPATANFIAKMANGMGDDFLSTMVLATTAQILVCPSMNTKMFENPAVQENLIRLKERGYTVMPPAEGNLACGAEGLGRLPEPDDIVDQAAFLLAEHDLAGLKMLVTAGAT